LQPAAGDENKEVEELHRGDLDQAILNAVASGFSFNGCSDRNQS
jgi:hypothetical protein